MRASTASFLFLSLVLSSSAAAAAPTKETCISAFDQAQQARRAGHLRQSREQLLICSQQECPAMVRADCADVLRQVDVAQPTIVLKAADANGGDLTDVSVELNGQKLATSLDGRAIAVDPGKLSLVFVRPPWKPVTVESVIAEGEKGRIVHATLGPPAPKRTTTDGSTKTDAPVKPRGVAGWSVPGAFALIGAVALTFAGLTRLSLGNEADDLRARCAPECEKTDRDRMSTELVTANVMLGVGIGTLALAVAAWFIFAPKSPAARAQAMKTVSLVW